MSRILSDILKGYQIKDFKGSLDVEINDIQFDSRKVSGGDLFVAIKGTLSDGHNYINSAIDKGAVAVICSDCALDIKGATIVKVDDTHDALAFVADKYYNSPSQQITLVGVTGTNGKTTVATTLYRFFRELGYASGLLSTVRYMIDDKEVEATHTTPDPLTINRLLREMVDAGCEYAFMEVSSHALDQGRTAYLQFDGAVFTNITHDHLDYHKTFANYIKAKKKFFDSLSSEAFALINADDKNGKIMVQNTKAEVYTYALKVPADFKAKILEKHFDGTLVLIDNKEVWLNFVGRFNVYNLLAVYAVAVLLDVDSLEALSVISKLKPVDGRFEIIKGKNDRTAIVDYAHTPDALENILKELNDIRESGQKIITVVGAGGNRDKTKRPEMGKIAAMYSDKLILTSDNPRSEDPEQIIEQMYLGVPQEKQISVIKLSDRREAIKLAVNLAAQGDIILIAGKGHETYQEIKGTKYHFDDVETVNEFINA